MRFLQIGLGSMGNRRIRCLKALGFDDIMGFDVRKDRRNSIEKLYGIKVVSSLDRVNFDDVDAIIVSTPPDMHEIFIEMAIRNKKSVFVEASVILGRLKDLRKAAERAGVMVVPSSTLRYHPGIKKIIKIVESGEYGKVTNFSYHSGQYLPDWHPYEKVKSFYASNKKTGAAREIVPFELTWIVAMTGFPSQVCALKGRTMDVGADIDDTYMAVFKFRNGSFGSLTVDVVCRYATRRLIVNLQYAQIIWRWDEQKIRIYDARNKAWSIYRYAQGGAAKGYNRNIAESMYKNELADFVKAVRGKKATPYTLAEDIKVLELLERIERCAQ